ncbi:reverse transcriptase domain-containing protein [Tanacetum coccineum]|uniref:Reverse transcriptase domain-containing protein n=1 Tax=Tanacetum coccineum TaxID=301880 RepID=A0ABQ5GMC4_9ASTR
MSMRLADRSFQYPVGIAENMLVKVVIRFKQKQLNLGVGTERMIFNIDYAVRYSYSNNDTCFSINVIDEILEEDFDALLDEGSKILHSIEGTLLEEEIFAEFDEFMAMTADKNSDSKYDTKEPPFEKITINTYYKIKTSNEEPPTDLELKTLPDNLVYVFLEEPSFLPVIMSSQLSKEKKNILDAHLVLNWEKCHFMVKEGIVLGHKVSSAGLEVDKAKIDVISKLPPLPILKKQDAKPCLIRWILLQQEFDIEIKDRKGGTLPLQKRTMKRYGVNHHFSTSYHPQTSGQVEYKNIALKRILEKTIKDNPAIWSRKLDDALWALCTAYKTPTNLIVAGEKRMFQLYELDELRHHAYENSRLYKERTKVWHNIKLRKRKEFKQGNKVLLFHSKYKVKQPKLRSRWLGPYVVKHQYPYEYAELYGKDGKKFIVNGHRLKLYHEEDYDPREAVTPFFHKE